jgi:hypothetical protein
MKIRLGELRHIIRSLLKEDPTGANGSADPTDVNGFYTYDVPRGVDVQGFWYRSPGREQGTNGDPGRPEDAAAYFGFKTKDSTPEEAAEEAKPKEPPPPPIVTKK